MENGGQSELPILGIATIIIKVPTPSIPLKKVNNKASFAAESLILDAIRNKSVRFPKPTNIQGNIGSQPPTNFPNQGCWHQKPI